MKRSRHPAGVNGRGSTSAVAKDGEPRAWQRVTEVRHPWTAVATLLGERHAFYRNLANAALDSGARLQRRQQRVGEARLAPVEALGVESLGQLEVLVV